MVSSLLHAPSSMVLRVIAVTMALLLPGTLVALLHPRLRDPRRRSQRLALLSWWPVTLYWALPCAFGPAVALLSTALLSAAALREYLRMLPPEDRHPALEALTYLAVPLHYAAATSPNPRLFFGGVLAWGGAVLPVARMLLVGPAGFLGAAARGLFGLVLCVLSLSHVFLVFRLPAHSGPAGAEGVALFLLLFVLMNDATQYIAGKLLGRTRLAPRLSPGKTWEGFLGGLVTNLALCVPFGRAVLPLPAPQVLALAALLSAAGLLGDLLVSAIKRDLGKKDAGAAIPGQGGVLDRHDSLLLNAPLYAWLAQAWTPGP